MKKILITMCLSAAAVCAVSAQTEVRMTLHDESRGGQIIPREIYGQFAEHLGRCIYGGIWVGESRRFPTKRVIASMCSRRCAR